MSTVRALSASEIFADIKAQPPLMREQAAKAYLGQEVDWALTFTNGSEEPIGRAWLMLRRNPRDLELIVGGVSLATYPSLRSLRPGEPVRVRGRIRKANPLYIELEITDLLLHQPVATRS